MLTRQASTPRGGKGTPNTMRLSQDRIDQLTSSTAKLDDVTRILGELQADLAAKTLPAKSRPAATSMCYRSAHHFQGGSSCLKSSKYTVEPWRMQTPYSQRMYAAALEPNNPRTALMVPSRVCKPWAAMPSRKPTSRLPRKRSDASQTPCSSNPRCARSSST